MIRVGILVLAAAGFAIAQSANAAAFEVASIRLHEGRAPYVGFKPSGSRFEVSAVSVTGMLMFAYDARRYQVTGGPGWADSDGWDIIAKAPGEGEPSPARFKQMMQQLLAGRFHVAFHRETKERAVYALAVAGKSRPKLSESTADAKFMVRIGGNQMTATGAGMDQLANQLTSFRGMDVPVINKTGLTGTYDYKLTWSEQDATEGDWDALLQDQLGLKLVRDKAPIEMLVIDRAEKPSEN